MNHRLGSGFDIHKLVTGRPLIIGGVHISHNKGSQGHSDGDVLIHSICDAILGALNLGDLGKYFPSEDNSIEAIDSKIILEKIVLLMNEKGAQIVNIDSTIIIEKPKLSSYISDMKKCLSPILQIKEELLSIKCKSHDKIGPLGNEEALAAQVSVLLELS